MSESRSPFDITEIVERIFSHVGDLSLRKTVPFVCRQWCLMINERPLRQIVWDNRWGTKLEPVLASLPGAGRFLSVTEEEERRLQTKPGSSSCWQWRHIQNDTTKGFQQQRNYFGRPISTNCRFFYMPLREVDLRIDFIEDDQLDYIVFPPSLTSLKLDIRNTTNKTLDLRLILSPRDRFEGMGMDSSRIYAIIQQLGLPIDSFHFSVTDCTAYATELRHKLYLYPRRPTEWSFWAQELEPYFMKELAMNTNNVTALDVFWERINRHNWSSCGLFTSTLQQLHKFLCSSPQLQSLKVANAAILLEAMDLHRRSGYIDPDCCVMFTRLAELEQMVVRPGIWASGSEEEMYWIPSVSGTLESGLTKHLEKLGLLSDVKDMMDEMDVDGYCCLPELKLVSFGGEVAQAPVDALGRLDPK
ncbi:hypothetical protein BGX24_002084 [Mortierella sp. AD032]|nr:hypothetical protein BGX24_002084 [Mortierella sp. AD032]